MTAHKMETSAAIETWTEVTLNVPLTFRIMKKADGTICAVTSKSDGKAVVFANANVAPRSADAAAIAAALGLDGALVSGNLTVFIPRKNAPADLVQKADARRVALDNDNSAKANVTPKQQGVRFAAG